MSDKLGVLHYTHDHVVKLHEGHNKLVTVLNEQHDENMAELEIQRDALHSVLRQVVACFKSRAESSTCIEDHHPSCLGLLEATLKVHDGFRK